MGQPVARQGDNVSADRGSFPVPFIDNLSPNVFANGLPVATVDSKAAPHWFIPLAVVHEVTQPTVVVGSPTVFANGKPMARISSVCHCSAIVIEGSPNVFCA